MLNKQQVNYYFSDFFFSKNSKYFSLFCQNRQVLLFPKFIVAYITNQLNKSGTLKRISFRKNLNLGILTFSFKLLKHLQNTVNGLKIICSGKWKKTLSGRKQKLTIKFGKIRNSTTSNKILYYCSTQKTKYGSCGIKVWISHKVVR